MRRENRNVGQDEGIAVKKVLYISGSILAIVIIGFVITFFVYGNQLEETTDLGKLNTSIVEDYTQNTEEASSGIGKTVNEMQNELTNTMSNSEKGNTQLNTTPTNTTTNTTKYAVNTSKVETNETKSDNTSKETTTKNEKGTSEVKNKKEETKTEEKDPEFKKPVAGEMIKEFAKDKLIYSNTLEEWVTHNGIDIKADKTTVIKAAAEGTVKSIKNDPRYGLTVVIEHSNGFTSVYSNLLTAEFVVEGEKVKQGQTIGTVGSTATFEIADEPHLHFEITKNGEYLDPELYIKE